MKEECKEEELATLVIFQRNCQLYETFFFQNAKLEKTNEPKFVRSTQKKIKSLEGKWANKN